jgi:hypothetical protein
VPFPTFDRRLLRLQPLSRREHGMDLRSVLALGAPAPPFAHPALATLADRILAAREAGRPILLLMGAHVLRAGVSRHLIDLCARGLVTHVGMNGGAAIHDFELALAGATTESVARYLSTGEFGLWEETGRLNDVAASAAREGIGFGEALGRTIAAGGFPHADESVLAAAHRLGLPATVHLGVGHDIVHEHPGCDGAAIGAASYTDFLVLAHTVSRLEGGVLLNVGTAVMGPEVFMKALAMARNVAHARGESIRAFAAAVFDLVDLPADTAAEASRDDPRYYYRPWKTVLCRSVADGGESFYVKGDHRATIPALWDRLVASAR